MQSGWRLAALGGALAMEMALAVAAGIVFGYALDQYFQTEPVLTIVFLLMGCAGGVVTFIKLLKFFKNNYGAEENGLRNRGSETQED